MYGRKKIVMERDEVDAIKKFDDPGLFLIGFKPMEQLKLHHHIRPAVFLYPEEDEVKGSSVCLCLVYFRSNRMKLKKEEILKCKFGLWMLWICNCIGF